jgi:3-deoxy-D-manno-octulosonic-acid transferase
VTEGLAVGAYRSVMRAAAGAAGVISRLPGAPAGWRALGDRLGRLGPAERATASGGTAIWVHAASVGELNAVRPLLRRMRERFPERLYVVSTMTTTGLALARELPDVHLAFLFPLDAPGTVRRLIRQFRLEAFLFTETEIWPSFLMALEAAGTPAFMVSGRVSERGAARARWLRPVYRRALVGVTCCMQTEADAERILALGADPRVVHVAGSLKFDGSSSDPPRDVQRVAAALGLAHRRLFVAGSTHEGEDEAVLAAYGRLAVGHRDLLLMLAPRHPERVAAVAAKVRATGLPLARYTELAAAPEGTLTVDAPGVVLLDAVGPLAHCYALAMGAFVGGSLVPVGGHNVLEPARVARPVLVGPHTQNCADVVERLVAGGAALRVSSEESLAWAIAGLLAEPERAADMGRRARALVEGGQGAVERHLKIIATRLSSAHFARAAGDT